MTQNSKMSNDNGSRSLDRALVACAIAAGGTIALSGEARATAVYTDLVPDVVLAPGGMNFDLNADGTNDFSAAANGSEVAVGTSGSNVSDIRFVIKAGTVQDATPLPAGTPIGLSSNFTPQGAGYGAFLATYGVTSIDPKTHITTSGWTASWIGDGYLGVEFDFGGQHHYGWVHMADTLDNFSGAASLTIKEWAYESLPDTAIAAGDTVGTGSPVPEPSSLALLAFGGAGVLARRRKQKAATKAA
jgi:hypothetical protein